MNRFSVFFWVFLFGSVRVEDTCRLLCAADSLRTVITSVMEAQ